MITIVELARQCECDHNTIRKWVKKNQVEVCKKLTGNRKYGDALSQTHADKFRQYWKDINTVPEGCVKLTDVAKECGVDRKTIQLWVERNAIVLTAVKNAYGPVAHWISVKDAEDFKSEYADDRPMVAISTLLEEFQTDWRVVQRWITKNKKFIHRMKHKTYKTALLADDAEECRVYLRDMKAKGYFYLIQLIPKHDPDRIKFGFAYDVDKRLSVHRITCPEAILLGVWKCRRDEEKSIIKKLTKEHCCSLTSEVFDCDNYLAVLERTRRYFD